jgi:hypothetical protein
VKTDKRTCRIPDMLELAPSACDARYSLPRNKSHNIIHGRKWDGSTAVMPSKLLCQNRHNLVVVEVWIPIMYAAHSATLQAPIAYR